MLTSLLSEKKKDTTDDFSKRTNFHLTQTEKRERRKKRGSPSTPTSPVYNENKEKKERLKVELNFSRED